MTDYSAIILAGGKSRRMGQKKGTLLFQGKTFLDIIIDKLRDMGISEIMISGYSYKSEGTIYVEDMYPNKGPLAGVHAGLSIATNSSVLVLTEDAPLIPAEYIRQMMEEHEKHLSPVTVASCADRLQHFPGIYEKSLAPLCESILQSERPTVMSLIEKSGCSSVPFYGDEMVIRGCNTPAEYEQVMNFTI